MGRVACFQSVAWLFLSRGAHRPSSLSLLLPAKQLGLGGASGGGGLWTDSGQCQEEEMQRPAARLAQGLAAPGTWVARWMVIPLTEI